MIIKKINVKLYALICFCIIYMFITDMAAAFEFYLPFNKYMIIVVFVLVILGIINELNIRNVKNNQLLTTLILFAILIISMTTVYLINLDVTIKYAISQLISAILWILILFYSYIISKYNPEVEKYLKIMVYVLPIFLLLYIKIKEYSNNRGIPLISCVYYLVFLLPILFMHKKKIIRIIGNFIIVCSLLLSQKRTGLLSMLAFFLVYFLVRYKIKTKNLKDFIKNFFIVTIFAIVVGSIAYNLIQNYDIKIIEKMKRIETDGGSGRIDIWINLVNRIKENNLFEMLFGHGFNAVYYDLKMDLSAHNDFLEILYDYGILGIILYMNLLKILIHRGFILLKMKKEISATFLASIALAMVFSMTSHLIIYPTYFIYFCLMWGYIMGVTEGESNEQN